MDATTISGSSDVELKWYSHWYAGALKAEPYIWRRWHDEVAKFFEQSDLVITHFGARSKAFQSGKYLQYQRSKNRLENELKDEVEFRHLSFVEMKTPFETLGAEFSFGVSLGRFGIEVDVRLDRYGQELCDSFLPVAQRLFRTARLIRFKTPATVRGIPELPCNLAMNYDYDKSIASDFVDVEVSTI